MEYILAVDYGSIFTKVAAIDVPNKKLLAVGKAIGGDDSFQKAVDDLFTKMDRVNFDKTLACSGMMGSAKMVSVGELEAEAFHMIAETTGAKRAGQYFGEIGEDECKGILSIQPDIVLLSGDDEDIISKNAATLAEIDYDFFVIVLSSKKDSDIWRVLEKTKDVVFAGDIPVECEKSSINMIRNFVREILIKRVSGSKKIIEIQNQTGLEIVPIQLACMEALKLISEGTEEVSGIGEIMAVDIGGMVTSVFSAADGLPQKPNVMVKGTKYPYFNFTVEGDLGLRSNLEWIFEDERISKISDKLGISEERIKEFIDICRTNPGIVVDDQSEFKKIEEEICRICLNTALVRHCGTVESIYMPIGMFHGDTFLQEGKDLEGIEKIICTGGAITGFENPQRLIMRNLDYTSLRPTNPKLLIDEKNILYAVGLIAKIAPEAAIKIMLDEIMR